VGVYDPEPVAGRRLEQPPEPAPLLHHAGDMPPRLELVNFGQGAARVVNTNTDQSDDPLAPTRSAGFIEILLAFLPWPVGITICAELAAPPIAYLGVGLVSFSIAGIGRLRRGRHARALLRQGTAIGVDSASRRRHTVD
jgi:hypothetical protein